MAARRWAALTPVCIAALVIACSARGVTHEQITPTTERREPTATVPVGNTEGPTPVQGTAVPEPTAVPTATVVPAPANHDLASIICSLDWPCGEALLVVYGPTPPNERAPYGCPAGESGGQSRDNGYDVGPFQLNWQWQGWRFERRGWTRADALDPYKNAAVAYELYSDQGWSPWSCRP